MCATDGHVLNVCPFTDDFTYLEGYYDYRLNPLPTKYKLKYPTLDRIVPQETVEETYHVKELPVHLYDLVPDERPQFAYRIGNGYFGREVLAIALQGRTWFKVLNADAQAYEPIKITGPTRWPGSYSVVMPMRRPDQ